MSQTDSILDLLDKYVPNRQPDHCWLWTGYIKSTGYGICHWQKKTHRAHRLVYEYLVSAVPKGLELDHLCRNRACVNPAHLEPVTHKENMRRGYRSERTHCVHGHELIGENTRWYGTQRICRTCAQQHYRRHQNWQGGPFNRDKTHCPKGHAYDEANTSINRAGSRVCRECKNQRSRANYHKAASIKAALSS